MDYKKFKNKKTKKIAILSVITVFIIVNIYILYTPFKRTYLAKPHAYPEAMKWEFLAMGVRTYGHFLGRYTSLSERDWIVQQFIALDEYFLDKAYQYIPQDDLQRHLKIANKYITYQAYNSKTAKIYKHNFYDLNQSRKLLDELYIQLEKVMTLETRSKFYEIDKYKVWQGLSYVYVMSLNAYWLDNNMKPQWKKYINDNKRLSQLIKLYNYNEYIQKLYKEKYPPAYRVYRRYSSELSRKHQLLALLFPYLLKNSEEYVQGNFCDIDDNHYLKGYIDSRNKLLEYRKTLTISGEINWVSSILDSYRDKLINQKCENINLIQGETYEYSKNSR